jgi:hypothetical protein
VLGLIEAEALANQAVRGIGFPVATQCSLLQAPLLQSFALAQTSPSWHFDAQAAPQSVVGSPPFLTPSTQLATAQVWVAMRQIWLAQSPFCLQALPSAQDAHVPPPQSVSVSALLSMLSAQLGN